MEQNLHSISSNNEPDSDNSSDDANLTNASYPIDSSMLQKTYKRSVSKRDCLPKLNLHKVIDESVAECSFETYKNARITFEFGIKEDAPEDIAEKMVIVSFSVYICVTSFSGISPF